MQIKRLHPNRKKTYVGRGGKRGKTSGRGMKGQKSRAGHKIRPAMRDAIKKLPRRRGVTINLRGSMHSSVNLAPVEIKVGYLENLSSGDTVTPAFLLEKRIVRKALGRLPRVKIIDGGELTKKVNLVGIGATKGARKKIEAVGGTIK